MSVSEKQKEFENPVRLIAREGAFQDLPTVVSEFQPKSILVVLGQKSFKASKYFKIIEKLGESYSLLWTNAIDQNPLQEFVQSEIERCKKKKFDLVLAVGGGSVLDVAKLLSVFTQQENSSLEDFDSGKFSINRPKVPLIAIATTSGTGSEVTPYSSIEKEKKKKISISDPSLFPTVAIVDPLLTYSMPAYVSASTGFDALSQGIESFWSVNATVTSRSHALRSVELISKNLDIVIRSPENAEARKAMAIGSCESGLGIAETKTTAVHSVSYPITTHFHVAHGHACALTLAEFIRFNAEVMKGDGTPLLKAFGVDSYEAMARKVEELMDKISLKRRLSDFNIDNRGIDVILQDAFRPDRVKNNPRPLSREELETILKKIA